METLLRIRGIKAIVVIVALHMGLGFNTTMAFAQQAGEVLGGAQTGIIPDGGDQANHEAMQALVNGRNQTLEDIEQFQTQMQPKEPANRFISEIPGAMLYPLTIPKSRPEFGDVPKRGKPSFYAIGRPGRGMPSRPEFGDVPKRGKPKFDGKPMPLGAPIFEGYVQGEKEASAVKPGFYGIGMATGNRPWIGMTDKERAVQRWLERQKKGDWRLPMRPR